MIYVVIMPMWVIVKAWTSALSSIFADYDSVYWDTPEKYTMQNLLDCLNHWFI